MAIEIQPGAGILYMKVGTHANESLEDIILRKQKEIEDEGFALWGYGGNTCHPTSMVQPFATQLSLAGVPLILAMKPMNSKHFAEPVRAQQMSADGASWQTIPPGVNARGSRFALVLDSLEEAKFELPLDATRVAVGRSMGRTGSDYIKGRVDKACLEWTGDPGAGLAPVTIELVGNVVAPHAVFLR